MFYLFNKFLKPSSKENIFWFLFSFFLGLIGISKFSFWRDEGFSVAASKFDFLNIVEIAAGDTHPPLHIFILRVFGLLFGFNEISMRIPSLIFFAGTVVAVYLLSKRIFENKIYSVISALVTATSPLMLLYAQEARAYSFLTFATLWTVHFALKIKDNLDNLEKVDSKNFLTRSSILDVEFSKILLFIFFSLLLLYSHSLGLIIFFVINFIVFSPLLFKIIFKLKLKNIEILLFLASINAVILIIYLPWFIIFINQLGRVNNDGFWLTFSPVKDILNTSLWLWIGQGYIQENWWQSLVINLLPVFGLLAFFLGLIYNIFKQKEKTFSLLFLGFTITIFLISFKNPLFYIRYLIFIAPFAFLVFASGIKAISEISKKWFALVFSSILIILNLINFYGIILQNSNLKADYRSLSSFSEGFSESDLIIHPNAFTFHSLNLYSQKKSFVYDPERSLPYIEGTAVLEEENYFASTNSKIEDYDKIIVVYLWENEDFNNLLKSKGFSKIEDKEFDGGLKVSIWKNPVLMV